MKEIFKNIPNYEGYYQVSNLGNVRTLNRYVKHWRGGKRLIKGKQCILTKQSKGYLVVDTCVLGIKKQQRVNQLVAMAFLNHIPCGHKLIVDHIDNNKLNNNLENLQIITSRENSSKDTKGKSIFIGVSWCKVMNKWRAQIYINGKVKYLGSFLNEIEASITYQKALQQLT